MLVLKTADSRYYTDTPDTSDAEHWTRDIDCARQWGTSERLVTFLTNQPTWFSTVIVKIRECETPLYEEVETL